MRIYGILSLGACIWIFVFCYSQASFEPVANVGPDVTISYREPPVRQDYEKSISYRFVHGEDDSTLEVSSQNQKIVVVRASNELFEQFGEQLTQAISYRKEAPLTASHPFMKGSPAKIRSFEGVSLSTYRPTDFTANGNVTDGGFDPKIFFCYSGLDDGEEIVEDCVSIVLTTDDAGFWPVIWKLDDDESATLLSIIQEED